NLELEKKKNIYIYIYTHTHTAAQDELLLATQDELLLATAWLHRATNDRTYLNYLVSTGKTGGTRSLFAWDDKYVGAQVLAGRLVFEGQGSSGGDNNNNNNKSSTGASSRSSSTGTLLLPQYKSQAEQFIWSCVQEGNNNNNLQKTPGGLLWFQPWIKLQYAATATFVVTVCSNYLTAAHASIQCSGGLVQPSDLMDLARSQADYILRKNPKEMSYTVGFGANYPTQPNHRGASIVSIKRQDSTPVARQGGFDLWFNSKAPNPNVLDGAVVGGPDENDGYTDSRGNFQFAKPCHLLLHQHQHPLVVVGVSASLAS
ncbi:LOW QUALITY PROTEIN: endoglucanase 12-like, partial [Citrus sinensis]|uniref:LOW QUALITY PROTEIN: endoglucanase 12-like n=1 Tax=Citrus sinensis TaxID=2711 RepID=UPI002278B55D